MTNGASGDNEQSTGNDPLGEEEESEDSGDKSQTLDELELESSSSSAPANLGKHCNGWSFPYTIAADMLLSGRRLSAQEAYQYGLVGYVVPNGSALEKALEIAERVNACGPLAVQAVKRTLVQSDGMLIDDALKLDLENGQPIFKTKDAKEGPTAFMEKRKPSFTGE